MAVVVVRTATEAATTAADLILLINMVCSVCCAMEMMLVAAPPPVTHKKALLAAFAPRSGGMVAAADSDWVASHVTKAGTLSETPRRPRRWRSFSQARFSQTRKVPSLQSRAAAASSDIPSRCTTIHNFLTGD